jgi:REP element-mobilizing transposase RayT
MQIIKGESSHWINKNRMTRFKFEWQDDYYAVSVGNNQIENLRDYIRSQVQHHQVVPFQEELKKFLEENTMEE